MKDNIFLWNSHVVNHQGKENNQVKVENKGIKQTASTPWLTNFIYKALQSLYTIMKGSIVKLVASDRGGQQVLVDIMSTEGSFLPSYNFLGTPQALYLLPVGRDTSSTVPYKVSVKPLEQNCFELVIEGSKRGKEDLDIKIYDEATRLIFSEQVTCTGRFKRLYDLKWPQLTDVSFEVSSKYGVGVHKPGII